MLQKTEIAERDALRQSLESQVTEFLSRGGRISVRPPGESAIPEKFPLGMRNRKDQKAYEYEMRARAARFEGEGYA